MRSNRVRFALTLAGLALLLAALACTYPGLEDAEEGLDLPTPAPTSAPVEPPASIENTPAPESSSYPLTFYKSGTKTGYGSSTDQSCEVVVAFTLTVNGDGSASLSATGPSIIDHINCTPGSDETWIANGTVNEAEQSVTFQSCNFGGFGASGKVYYGTDILTGQVTCTWSDGSTAVTLFLGE